MTRNTNVIPVTYTVAPASPSCSAMPFPMPRVAPVTMHTLPASVFPMFYLFLCTLQEEAEFDHI